MRRSRVALALVAVVTVAGVLTVPAVGGRPAADPPRTTTPADDLVGDAPVPLEAHTDDDGRLTAVGARPGQPLDVGADDPVEAATTFADRYASALGVAGSTLEIDRTTDRIDGGTAVRFQQASDGVPVLGGELSVQVDGDGAVVSALADLSVAAASAPTAVEVDEEAARRTALVAVAREVGTSPTALTAEGRGRWIHDPEVLGGPSPLGPRLTWRFEVTGAEPPVRHLVLVDAATGSVAVSFSLLGHAAPRQVCDFADVPSASPACTTPARTEGAAATGIGDVDAAYDHTGATRDWFLDRFGRDGVDGQGTTIRSSVRYCTTTNPCPYVNAFWDGTQAVYGRGFATDDVVAHELTHGVTEHTAGLYYWYQSGAINEAMSDIFGELIDLATPGDGTDDVDHRWEIGEDLPIGTLRDMADPAAFGDPDAMTSPAFYSGEGNNGGVHINNGVANRAAVLMVDGGSLGGQTVPALGEDKVAAVHYEALTALLTSASDYQDLHVALPQACRNLVGVGTLGITPADCDAVQAAVDAVDMDHVPVGQPTEAPVCAAGITPQFLHQDDLETTPTTGWLKTRVLPSAYNWVHPVPAWARNATSGTQNLWGATTGDPWNDGPTGTAGEFGDSRIAMTTDVALPTGVTAYLRFRHAHGFESSPDSGGTLRNWDGGVVEYSTNGGTTWLDAGALFDHNGYTGTLNATGATANPLHGRPAFTGRSRGYTSSRADLTPLAGQAVRFRFRVAEDHIIGDHGWFVDDLSIHLCPVPALEVTQEATPATVTAGEDIDVTVTLTNTGETALTGVTVTEATLAGCEGPVDDLAVDAAVDVTCSTTTVDPDDVGSWDHEVTATAAELAGPVTATPVSVTVLAPDTPDLTVTHDATVDTVDLGGSVPLGISLRNTGNVDLTGLTITASDAPGCAASPAETLAPNDVVDLTCEHTPTALGPWTSTVTVDAVELDEAVTATTGTVTVTDGVDPSAVITSPADGALFNQGQVVTAGFSCSDDQPGEVDCTATAAGGLAVEDGAAVPTDAVGTHAFTVTAVDAAGNRTELTHQYTVAERRPDAIVRRGKHGARRGEDVYHDQGEGQVRTARPRPGRTATFYVTVQNDGDHAEALRVRGQVGNRWYRVRYFRGATPVTGAVRHGTYETPTLEVDGSHTLRVEVRVDPRAPRGSRIDRWVKAISTSDPVQKDAVRVVVRRR